MGKDHIMISAVVDITGASQRDIENWTSRLELSSHFVAPGQGRARPYSRENTLELALLAAFVAAGMPPAFAAPYARNYLNDWKHLRKPVRRWLVFVAGDPRIAKAVDELSNSVTKDLDMKAPAPVLSAIDVAEIFERIEEYFGEEA